MHNNRFLFLILLLLVLSQKNSMGNDAASIKPVLIISAACVTLPITYRLGRWTYFKSMSAASRMGYAHSFYYKLSTRYFEAINRDSNVQLEMIVSRSFSEMIRYPGLCKSLWRFFDYLSAYQSRQKFKLYPYLYYQDVLARDIKWLRYYVDHLSLEGDQEYARQKQHMRNLLGQLELLFADVRGSYGFQKENRKHEQAKQQRAHQKRLEQKLDILSLQVAG